jgi:hypothetical protein
MTVLVLAVVRLRPRAAAVVRVASAATAAVSALERLRFAVNVAINTDSTMFSIDVSMLLASQREHIACREADQ